MKMKIILISVFVFAFSFSNSSAEENSFQIDSLKKIAETATGEQKLEATYRLGLAHSWSDIEVANQYYREALVMAKELNVNKTVARCFANIGANLRKTGRIDSSTDTLLLAYDYFEKAGDYAGQAFCLSQVANNYQILGEDDRATDYFLKAFRALDKRDINETIEAFTSAQGKVKDSLESYLRVYALVYNDAGLQYYHIGNNEKARKYFNEALKVSQVINQKSRIAGCYSNLAMIHSDIEEWNKALELYQKALRIVREVGNKDYEGTILNNIGNIYSRQKEYSQSIDYYEQAYKLYNEVGQLDGVILALINSSYNYIHMGRTENGIPRLREALKLAIENNFPRYQMNAYTAMSKAYERYNRFDSALKYTRLAHDIQDSIFSIEKAEKISELELAYETAKKDKKIELLRKESEMAAAERTFFIILAIFAIAIIVIILIFYRSKIKNNTILREKNAELEDANKKLEEQSEELKEVNDTKDKFFTIIAHDLKNPFGLLVSISKLLVDSYHELEEAERRDFIKDIQKSTIQIYNLLENLLQWSRSQTGRLEFQPREFNARELIDEVMGVLRPNAQKKEQIIEENIDNTLMINADPNMFQFIIRNLLSNAIKFTPEGGRISIESDKINGMIKFSVSDTGIGIPQEDFDKLFLMRENYSRHGTNYEKGTGLGLIVFKEFVDMHGGSIDVKSKVGEGSTFSFTLPEDK